MATWISTNPELAGFALLGAGMLLQKLASPFLGQAWARLWGLERKHRFVSHEELNECVGAIQLTLAEIKSELARGSACFERVDQSTRTLADVTHALCQIVQPLTDTDLGCSDLLAIIRDRNHAR